MKKSKKILMALAICSLSVVAIGCSSNEKKNTSNGTTETTEKKENKETKEDKTEKLSNEEIVKKLTEAFSSINSSKQKTEFKNTFNSFGRKAETTLIMDVITSSSPNISKVSSTMIDYESKDSTTMYYTEDKFYAYESRTKDWYNIKDEKSKKRMLLHKESSNIKGIIDFINSIEKNLKIEEKDSEYEISYSGADDSIKDYLKKIMILFLKEKTQNKVNNLLNVEKIELFYKIDKNTFVPKEYTVEINLKIVRNGEENVFKINVKGEISDINKVEPIKIPDEVKNAKDYTGK